MIPIRIASDPGRFAAGEAHYLAAREREGRRLGVDEVRRLPDPPAGSRHAREWRTRAASAGRLLSHLSSRRARSVLDLGCGNGWLAARMARTLGARVTAVDVNRSELSLAAEAFDGVAGLELVLADVFEDVLPRESFDAAVVASAAQYFPDLPRLVRRLFDLLSPGGEVLLLDGPLWRSASEAAAATERSRLHYESVGTPELAGAFHHHERAVLAPFSPRWYFLPERPVARFARRILRRPLSPFPFVGIPRP
jgi:SAM-dependent methyltransferase